MTIKEILLKETLKELRLDSQITLDRREFQSLM